MIREIDVSSREAYLQWVHEWKGWWHATVEEIRYHKKMKRVERDYARYIRNIGPSMSERQGESLRLREYIMQRHHNQVRGYPARLQWRARRLLESRMEGKILSQEAKQRHLTTTV